MHMARVSASVGTMKLEGQSNPECCTSGPRISRVMCPQSRSCSLMQRVSSPPEDASLSRKARA
eukprot:2611804-Heterocapsa_arctica.AAC.1